MKVGSVVLMRDLDVHRNQWPLGVILRVFSSSDGKVRKVEVRTSRQTYIRPVGELVLLLDE